jgi:methylase of polypeptide subunit release factors
VTLVSEPRRGDDPSTALSTTAFGPLEVHHDPSVLAPRPWTLAQARWAVDLLRAAPDGDVLELCAGVGHIGQVVALETGRCLVQVDASTRACELARTNAAAAGLTVDVRLGQIDGCLAPTERFALVIADPPYVPTAETKRFSTDPTDTIDGGQDGLDVARRCAEVAVRHLDRDGLLLVQLWNGSQALQLAREIAADGLLEVTDLRVVHDCGALLLLRSP